jgi:hypothetical protein
MGNCGEVEKSSYFKNKKIIIIDNNDIIKD